MSTNKLMSTESMMMMSTESMMMMSSIEENEISMEIVKNEGSCGESIGLSLGSSGCSGISSSLTGFKFFS